MPRGTAGGECACRLFARRLARRPLLQACRGRLGVVKRDAGEANESVVRASGLALWGAFVSVGSVAGCVASIGLTLTVSPMAATAVLALPVVSFAGATLCALGLRSKSARPVYAR